MSFGAEDLEQAVGEPDLDEILEQVDRMSSLLIQAGRGYDDDSWKRFDQDYQRTTQSLSKALGQLGMRSPFGLWPTLATWHASSKQHGGYASRDQFVRERIAPLRRQLQERIDDRAAGDIRAQLAALDSAATESHSSPETLREHLRRIERAIDVDPGQAIGAAKNLVESTAKIVLASQGVSVGDQPKLPALVKKAMASLGNDPSVEPRRSVRDMLAKLGGIAAHLGELRNAAGDSHGREEPTSDLELRHGRLAARAAVAWSAFILESLQQHDNPYRR